MLRGDNLLPLKVQSSQLYLKAIPNVHIQYVTCHESMYKKETQREGGEEKQGLKFWRVFVGVPY